MMFKSILRSLFAAAILVGLTASAAVDTLGHDIVHAPAPAPASEATVVRRRTKKCKKSKDENKAEEDEGGGRKLKSTKKSKSKSKEKKSKKSKSHKKEEDCEEWETNRVPMESSCQSDEGLPIEEIVVAYNYTIEVDNDSLVKSAIKEMESSIHETIVNDQLRCDDPVVRRRKLGGIRHQRKLIWGNDDKQLKVVGTDPKPEDKPSKTNFCLIGVDNCVSINGFVTLLLEGEVADEKDADKEREEVVSGTRDSIKKTFRESDNKVFLVQKFGEARNNGGYQSAQDGGEESSFSAGGALAGVLAAGLAVAGAAFVYKKKKKNGAAGAGSREVHADAEGVPMEGKVLKEDQKDSVPIATVVEEMPVQSSEDKSKLKWGFGKSAVPH